MNNRTTFNIEDCNYKNDVDILKSRIEVYNRALNRMTGSDKELIENNIKMLENKIIKL